jgi:hypothetical protein
MHVLKSWRSLYHDARIFGVTRRRAAWWALLQIL